MLYLVLLKTKINLLQSLLQLCCYTLIAVVSMLIRFCSYLVYLKLSVKDFMILSLGEENNAKILSAFAML